MLALLSLLLSFPGVNLPQLEAGNHCMFNMFRNQISQLQLLFSWNESMIEGNEVALQ